MGENTEEKKDWVRSYLAGWARFVKYFLCWFVMGVAIFGGGVAAGGLYFQALVITIVGAMLLFLAIEL